jgi:hypothetical protein
VIRSTREHVAAQLIAYGEDGAAARVLKLNDEAFEFIEVKAAEFDWDHDTPNLSPILLDKALSLAAIFVLEGKVRPLKRRRRKFS